MHGILCKLKKHTFYKGSCIIVNIFTNMQIKIHIKHVELYQEMCEEVVNHFPNIFDIIPRISFTVTGDGRLFQKQTVFQTNYFFSVFVCTYIHRSLESSSLLHKNQLTTPQEKSMDGLSPNVVHNWCYCSK